MVERGAGEASSPDRAQLLFQEALIHLQKFVEGIAISIFKLGHSVSLLSSFKVGHICFSQKQLQLRYVFITTLMEENSSFYLYV